MKIQTEHLQALQNTEVHRKTAQAPEGFDALLAQRMAAENDPGSAPVAGTEVYPRGPIPLSPAEGINPPVLEDRGTGGEIASRLESLFTGLEEYAHQLAADAPDALRGAYSLLENVTEGIASLKSAHPDMAQGQPALAAMVNELEILAVNETFKFNRGDYSDY
jgi:hypothetical protein